MISLLLSPAEKNSDFAAELERSGTRIITWPRVQLAPPENHAALDEAIANLFGYDWLILKRVAAAEFFFKRFEELNREKSELDELRVCVIGEEAAPAIRESQIHVDIEVGRANSSELFSAIESYVGGSHSLAGLNFLVPSANVKHETIQNELEDAGARVDSVVVYRTTHHAAALAQLNALLVGGGIDGVFFRSATEIRELADLFDTYDLGSLLRDLKVICATQSAHNLAVEFGIVRAVVAEESSTDAVTSLIAATLGSA